jgi:hypothetical protein
VIPERCACCGADGPIRWPVAAPQWCVECYSACQTVRLTLRYRLGRALADSNQPAAKVVQGALRLLMSGFPGGASR